MNDEIRVSRNASVTTGGRMGVSEVDQRPRGGQSKLPWVIVGLLVIILLAALVLFRGNLMKWGRGDDTSKTYQAVFLSNGQVYFGHISNIMSKNITLTDIFYLQVTPAQGSQQSTQANTNQSQQLQLVKLGSELHGPEDKMNINRDHVLFYENLKKDGKVVKAIEEYKANPDSSKSTSGTGGGSAQTQAQQPATNSGRILISHNSCN
jgi:hypothetical protein